MPELPNSIAALDVALGVSTVFLLHRVYSVVRSQSGAKSYKLPPGPRPLPLIGNLLDLPKEGEKEWIHWAKHRDLYGPISSVTVFGQTIIIVNDRQSAVDLFEKRSAAYSERPVLTFGGEMCGWSDSVVLQRYGPYLQTMRRHIHKFMGTPKTIERFHDLLYLETRRLLLQVQQSPDSLHDQIRSMAGAIILKLNYGYRVNQKGEDPLVKLADEAMQQFSETMIPGTWLVDTIPALRHLPDWVPGATFKKTAKRYLRTFATFKDRPHAFVKRQMSEGVAPPSFTADLLEQEEPNEEYESTIKNSAVSLFAGGADTTVSSLYSFFLAMVLYPDVQKRAQAEIDSVIGTSRLPRFEDSPDLPYINALVKETHRWNPVAPMGFAHVTSEDDVYQDHFIPKDAPVIVNVWKFTHDPTEYHDPMAFKPERFLSGTDSKPERDPREMTFGFGRRICPGRELANASMFIAIAMVLAVFDISPPRDANGRETKPRYEYNTGLISHPKDFGCIIVPRSERAAGLVRSVEEEYPLDSGDADKLLELDVN